MKIKKIALSSIALSVLMSLHPVCAAGTGISSTSDENSTSSSLVFDASAYTEETATVNDQTVEYRAYEGIVYVANPVDTTYQIMNVYVPEAYYQGGTIQKYNKDTAPIYIGTGISGYLPAAPQTATVYSDGTANNLLQALAHGYVVASPGARGRNSVDDSGDYDGKAPAAVVDLKAAVRYLHFNDSLMPGNANRIVSDGTSAGGAISALLGSTEGDARFDPYLKALGAANASDKIYADMVYCPITDLDHADAAYEWQFNGYGDLDSDEQAVSDDLAAQFPPYINGLGLKDDNGNALTLDKDGNGSFKQYILNKIKSSAQLALNEGEDLSRYEWLTIDGNTVTAVDWDAYRNYAERMKEPPAFDALDLSANENEEFGTATVDTRHFTKYSYEHSAVADAEMAPDYLVKMMNPMTYLYPGATTITKNWRIRVGTDDTDASLAITGILAARLKNLGYSVDYAMAWDEPHGGDYDLDELFAWIDGLQ